jgi:hypothetical protein
VELGVTGDKIGWDLAEEVWLNVTNPTVREIYEKIRNTQMSEMEYFALSILVSLIDNDFDSAIIQCVKTLTGKMDHNSPRKGKS